MLRLPKTLNAGLIINANNNLSLQLVIQVACKMLLLMYTVMITDAEAGNTHKRLKKFLSNFPNINFCEHIKEMLFVN